MKVLLDTNIIVDFLAKRPAFFDDARKIIDKCKTEEMIGIVAVHTVSTLFYLLLNFGMAVIVHEVFERSISCFLKKCVLF